MVSESFKSRVVMNKKTGKLTLYVYMPKEKRSDFILEKGKQPCSIMDVVLV